MISKSKTIYFRKRENKNANWDIYREYKTEYDARKAFNKINKNNTTVEYRRGLK
jgi:hypothetical protein